MNKVLVILVGMFLLTLATGCDLGGDDADDDSGADGDVPLSVDEDKQVSDLTEDEMMDVCGDIYDVVAAGMADAQAAVDDMSCVIAGVMSASEDVGYDGTTDADLQASCAEIEQACENGELDDSPDFTEVEGEMTEEDFCEGADEAIEGCDATAGEIANCMVALFTAQMSTYKTYLASIPECDELTADFYDNGIDLFDDASDETELPSQCDVINQKCPEILADFEKK